MTGGSYVLEPIGWVESPLAERATAPRSGKGAPDAWPAGPYRHAATR